MTTEAGKGGSPRVARGKAARATTPLGWHADFTPARGRDPVGLLLDQAKTREPDLVPVRHGRMLVSPFAYYRGAALPMTADLADTPVSGLRAQLCGDAHLANFGAFASPERRLMFDINDFDETLPGPFEWDVKRLAASFAVIGRHNNFSRRERRGTIRTVANTYRLAMRAFARQPATEVWYAHLDMDDALARFQSQIPAKARQGLVKLIADARTRDNRQALRKLTTMVDGQPRFISNPPTLVPIEELFAGVQSEAMYNLLGVVLSRYRRSLQSDRRHLAEQFELVQVARKVVGVGSVGQRAWAVLLAADEGRESLLLQAKEAQPSILSDHCGRTRYRNEGERVVAGQHLMQAASDIFLGWTGNLGAGGESRDFYVRQLRDWKLSFPIEQMRPPGMTVYAYLCGWTLARAHARSGDRIAIAAYLGRTDTFDRAIADFAEAYADQNDHDYADFRAAVDHGRATAVQGV
jgi:uncharacterized protein (DUF2252 family)